MSVRMGLFRISCAELRAVSLAFGPVGRLVQVGGGCSRGLQQRFFVQTVKTRRLSMVISVERAGDAARIYCESNGPIKRIRACLRDVIEKQQVLPASLKNREIVMNGFHHSSLDSQFAACAYDNDG